ncbi:MAG: hypothetical protein KGZ56_08735 [Dethiobacter sp.]|nr:hypothetical protein [Dethiobacter sp.]
MRKVTRKIIMLGMSLVMACVLTTSAFAQNLAEGGSPFEGIVAIEELSQNKDYLRIESENLAQFSSEFWIEHDSSVESYDSMRNSFGRSRDGSIMYPDFYGGAFIDDYGVLNVFVKDSIETRSVVSNAFAQSLSASGVIIRPAQYSFNELNETMDKLNAFRINNPDNDVAHNFNKFWLSNRSNEIIVELNDFSDEQIALFRNTVSDSPMIVFIESSGFATRETIINPGNRINNVSMGYRARRGGINGFVTAAHGGQTLNATVHLGGTTGSIVGTVTARQESGSVDAAFVQTNVNVTPTNNIINVAGTNQLSTTISEPGSGTVINKIGFATGHTHGRIISTNASWFVDNIQFTNLTTADYHSAPGDSGGIVYSFISSTNTRPTLGIHMGSSGTTRFFVKANQINSALGLTRY